MALVDPLSIKRVQKGLIRLIQKLEPTATTDGMGASVKRLMPTRALFTVDPFLLMDHFAVKPPAGFPPHPHRGFEIITYMLTGAFRHEDDAGNQGIIPAGGLQRITAGAGIVHAEMPATEDVNEGIQLWINLPRSDKGVVPSYQDVAGDQLPTKRIDGAIVKTIVGDGSPVDIRRPMRYEDVTVFPGIQFQLSGIEGFQGLVYVLEGRGRFVFDTDSSGQAPVEAGAGEALVFSQETIRSIRIVAHEDSASSALRLIWFAGEPIGERPIFRGSFVD